MNRFKFEDIAFNSTAKKKPVEEDKYTYLGLENLDSGTLKVSRYGSEIAPIGEKLLMRKGDVLFGKRRAYQKKVAIAPFDGIFSAHGMVLRPKTDVVDADFFPLFISSDYFLDKAINISVGSLSPTINWKDLRVLEFNLPSLEEQKELSKVLWSIVNTIESYKVLINRTDSLIASEFGKMNEGGETKKIKDICTPFSSDLLIKQLLDNDGNYPLYGATGVVKNIDFYKQDKEYISIIKWGAGVGRVDIHEAESSIVGSLQGILPNDQIDIIWLACLLRSINLSAYASQTTVPNLYFKDYGEHVVVVPNYDKQLEISSFIKQAEKAKNDLQYSLEELQKTYKKIIATYLHEED